MSSEAAAQRFLNAAQNGKVLGAYLLVCSRRGIAERLADLFLQKLFCKQGGCGRCTDCAKVAEGHIDILRLCAPKVDELREALGFVAERPYEGDCKAVVIGNADDMTPQAANSLLKTLEEPPQGTVFLLITRSVTGVLPTIASRCAIIALSPSPDAASTIAAQLDCDETTAAILADLSGGYPQEAQRIYADKDFLMRREEMLCLFSKLLLQKGMAISTFADYLETVKEHLQELISVMLSYLRDIRVFQKTRNECLVVNRDKLEEIRNAADIFTSGAIRNMINVLFEAERRFFTAVNFRLALEKMLFCILEEKNKWSKS